MFLPPRRYQRPSDDRTRNRSNEESGVAQTKPIALEDKRKKQAPAFFKSWQRDSRSKSLVLYDYQVL
jgi:hypothetical protein